MRQILNGLLEEFVPSMISSSIVIIANDSPLMDEIKAQEVALG